MESSEGSLRQDGENYQCYCSAADDYRSDHPTDSSFYANRDCGEVKTENDAGYFYARDDVADAPQYRDRSTAVFDADRRGERQK